MYRRVLSVVFLIACLFSCKGGDDNPNKDLSIDAFGHLRVNSYLVDGDSIRENIAGMVKADGILMPSDRFVRAYYGEHKPFLWISHNGVAVSADTLLEHIGRAEESGIRPQLFRAGQIMEDIEAIRTFNVESGHRSINQILARIEYNLTRSYLRYTTGQYYGFINPNNIYNKLDTLSHDSVGIKWKRLCDLRVKRPDSTFYANAIARISTDSIGTYVSRLMPKSKLYSMLVSRLSTPGLPARERLKTLCNIERCRWRLAVMPCSSSKYVTVNIPSYNLRAVNGDSVLCMRVCCGAKKTKTPILSSMLMRMDFNPQWIVPKSIAVGYVGRNGYMHSQGMFVYDKKLGKLPPEEASYTKINNGEQYIIQSGGAKNSLGRIIFRFENNFSVFLHDTSAPWHFQSSKRAISHGCVRVEKPYELALFMLNSHDKALPEKIKYTMSMDIDAEKEGRERYDKSKIVRNIKIEPNVPLFITYYTIYYGAGGHLVSYEDVYGYDDVTIENLYPYIKL